VTSTADGRARARPADPARPARPVRPTGAPRAARSARPARTVFIGSGPFAVPALRALASDPAAKIVGVVSAPPRPSGRGLEVLRTPVAEVADELGLTPVLTPRRLRDPEAIGEVLATKPVLVVLADYGQIVPAALLGVRKGALNLHPSLLPRHRGASPIPGTILAGDGETGVTLMLMDEGLDTGPIVAQVRSPVDDDETAVTLETRLADAAAELLTTWLSGWLRGELSAQPQPAAGATLTKPLRREDGRLDPTRSAAELERQVRAYQPWPGSFVDTVKGRLVVWSAGATPGEHQPAGRFVARGLATADGTLLLHDVQPAGGRRMPWVEFLRGRAGIVGSAALASTRDR
jgi:methionyl-tRNA formyltransferase